MIPRSIQARLLLSLLAALTLIWLVTAGLAYRDARHEVDELLDAHLAQSAALLLAQSGEIDEIDEIDTEHAPQLHPYSRRVAFQVWEDGERLRLHSLGAPDTRLSARDEGFSDAVIDNRRWRVYSVRQDDWLIQVAEEDRSRAAIGRSVGRNLILPLLLGLPLLGVLIAWSVRRSLRPLVTLSTAVGRLAPERLTPLPVPPDTPGELQPLFVRLNTLLGQLAASFESERRFTADAAHELRNPIAGLKAQAQVAQRAASDAERQQALAQIIAGCDRAARLIEQLLTLARLEPAHLRRQAAKVELRPLAAGVISEIAPAALQRGIELALEADDVAAVGHADLLAVLLRNLLDNAIRYSPADSLVRVRIATDGGRARLEVIDQGAGIPPEQRSRLGQRFQRLDRADTGGTGLGLSIVRRIAELHGATLRFDTGEVGRGLRVELALPDARG